MLMTCFETPAGPNVSLVPLPGVVPATPVQLQAAVACVVLVVLQAAVDVFQIDVNTVIQDLQNGVPQAQLRQDLQALQQAFIDLIQAEAQFFHDQHQDAGNHGGDAPLTHSAGKLDFDLFDTLAHGFGKSALDR